MNNLADHCCRLSNWDAVIIVGGALVIAGIFMAGLVAIGKALYRRFFKA